MNRITTKLCSLSFAAIAAVCSSVSYAAPIFIGLGDLPGGIFNSIATEYTDTISRDGNFVIGRSSFQDPISGSTTSASADQAFRWSESSGMVALGTLSGDSYSTAQGISADGSVVVGYSSSPVNLDTAYRWTESDGMVSLGDLEGGQERSLANGVSSDGNVVVGFSNGENGNEAFRWTETDGMVGLGTLSGGTTSNANGVSADGSVVVGRSNGTVTEAFRWTETDGMVGLGDLTGGSTLSIANGVSEDGSVVIGQSGSATAIREAFRWTEADGMIGLGTLSGHDSSVAHGLSADGSVIVGGTIGFDSEAFIWTAVDGMLNLKSLLQDDFGLDLSGWTLSFAHGVSGNGLNIAGWGFNPDGNREAWFASLNTSSSVPEPSTLILLGLGLAGLGFNRRRAT